MAILVTGGAGYIGSHTAIELLQAGYDVVIADNFSNSRVEVLNRIRLLTDREITYYNVDLMVEEQLEKIFEQHGIDAVIHFAGLKSVAESVAQPLRYYNVNLTSTLNLLTVMEKYHTDKLVFSSTAAVYGRVETVPISENAPLQASNPYGRTKQMIERMLTDLASSNPEWGITMLRYFNPVGAHPSGIIGEDPAGVPNNLMPYLTLVAAGKRPELRIFGNDYDTKDGTGIRDYIHVVDLAKGHLKALEYTLGLQGAEPFNLGTGRGYSVLELVETFEKSTGIRVPYHITNRRPGDVAVSFADSSKANEVLDWKAEKGLEEMCMDAWHWQEKQAEDMKNPK